MPARDISKTHSCKFCNKEFHPYKGRPGNFCSRFCSHKGRKMRETVYIKFKCQNCGIECKKPKYSTSSTFEFCSSECRAVGCGKKLRGENHPKWKGGNNRSGSHSICNQIKKEIGKCERCDSKENLHVHHKIKVSERPDLADEPTNIEVLSNKCHAKEHPEFEGMLLKKKGGVYKNCKVCGEEFYRPKYRSNSMYCSNKCKIPAETKRFQKKCLFCEKEFYTIPSKSEKSKFCSNRCKMLMRHRGDYSAI